MGTKKSQDKTNCFYEIMLWLHGNSIKTVVNGADFCKSKVNKSNFFHQ